MLTHISSRFILFFIQFIFAAREKIDFIFQTNANAVNKKNQLQLLGVSTQHWKNIYRSLIENRRIWISKSISNCIFSDHTAPHTATSFICCIFVLCDANGGKMVAENSSLSGFRIEKMKGNAMNAMHTSEVLRISATSIRRKTGNDSTSLLWGSSSFQHQSTYISFRHTICTYQMTMKW